MTLPERCRGVVVSAAAALCGCTPAHDWRDVRPAGTPLLLQMPCRPVAEERPVTLAGGTLQLSLSACTAGGQTWALAHADTADPARVGAVLADLRSGTLRRAQAVDGKGAVRPPEGASTAPAAGATASLPAGRAATGAAIASDSAMPLPLTITAATPNTAAGRWRLQMPGAGGAPSTAMEFALFAHGTQVFQASVLGATLPADAVETFFASLRFTR